MGLFSKIGGLVNDVLGGTSSAKQAQQYQKEQMAIQNMYNEKYAQNAHQWEISDLQKAGLNPVLSAGGSSASAIAGSSTSTGGHTSSTNGNIMDIMGTLSSMGVNKSQSELNTSTSAKNTADTQKTIEETKFIPEEKKAQIGNVLANTALQQAQTAESSAKKAHIESETAINQQGLKGKIFGTESIDSPIGIFGSLFNGNKDRRKKH